MQKLNTHIILRLALSINKILSYRHFYDNDPVIVVGRGIDAASSPSADFSPSAGRAGAGASQTVRALTV